MTPPFQYIGRDLNAGAIDLSVTGTAAIGVNTDKAGNAYDFHVNAASTIDTALFAQFLPSYIAKPMMCSQALQRIIALAAHEYLLRLFHHAADGVHSFGG